MIKLPWYKSQVCFGIYVGVSSAHAVLLKQVNSETQILKHFSEKYTAQIKPENEYKPLVETLNRLLDHFSNELESDYIPVQISLADILVNSAVFELDQVPKSQSTKNDLIAMRFKKECHINIQESLVSSQLYKFNNRHALYAIASPKMLIDSIEQCLIDKQLHVMCIDKAIHYVFNHFYEELDTESAMLFNSGEYWTLIIWDNHKNTVYFRSKVEDTASLQNNRSDDVLRLLHTYQQSHPHKINSLYIVNTNREDIDISGVIEQNDEYKITPLTYNTEKSGSLSKPNEPALFAARQR